MADREPSNFSCLLFRLFQLRLTGNQLVRLLEASEGVVRPVQRSLEAFGERRKCVSESLTAWLKAKVGLAYVVIAEYVVAGIRRAVAATGL